VWQLKLIYDVLQGESSIPSEAVAGTLEVIYVTVRLDVFSSINHPIA
jgi:hypothetical protein